MGGRRFTQEEMVCIADMYHRGISQKELAIRFDRSAQSISDVLVRMGVSTRRKKETKAMRIDGTLNNTQNELLCAIDADCEKTVGNICYLSNDDLAKFVGVTNISSDLTVLTRKGYIGRETTFHNGYTHSVRKIWITEKGEEYLKEYKCSLAQSKVETMPISLTEADMPTSKMVDDRVVILNDILQALRHLTDRIDAIAQIGYDQRDKEIVYAKAQLDKLSSISATIHKEEKE